MSTDLLVAGAFVGSILTIIAIAIPRYTRHILAATLVGAALVYIHFAVAAHAGTPWLAAEVAGVAIYGAFAVRGVRHSAWWLVAGWTLHPVWDVVLHFAGPGHGFAPDWYTVSCLTWDLATATIIAIAILIGTHLSDASPGRMSSRASEAPPVSFRASEAPPVSFRASEASRGIARIPTEGPLHTVERDSATSGLPPFARNDLSCTCPACTTTEAHAA